MQASRRKASTSAMIIGRSGSLYVICFIDYLGVLTSIYGLSKASFSSP